MAETNSQIVRHILEFPQESHSALEPWIPMLQSAVWPLFALIILFIYRAHVYSIISSLEKRISLGDPWTLGPFAIGSGSPKMDGEERPKELKEKGEDAGKPGNLPNTIYIVHQSQRDPSRDTQDMEYHRVRIYLDADTPELFAQVEKVEYHLHPSFNNPIRLVSTPETHFELRTIAWGEFNMTADIFLKGRPDPLTVERYINFQ